MGDDSGSATIIAGDDDERDFVGAEFVVGELAWFVWRVWRNHESVSVPAVFATSANLRQWLSQTSNLVCDSSFEAGSHSQRFMYTADFVVVKVQSALRLGGDFRRQNFRACCRALTRCGAYPSELAPGAGAGFCERVTRR